MNYKISSYFVVSTIKEKRS